MSDQAQSLRELKNKKIKEQAITEVITIASGKGGVGKSNTSVNLALALGKQGFKVLLIDVDLGLANADLLLGLYTRKTLFDFFEYEVPLSDIITEVNKDVHLISGGSALADASIMESVNREHLKKELNKLEGYNFIIFDTGAGINKDVTYFSLLADRIIIITTPEPTSITDAYALLKSLYKTKKNIMINIVVNKAIHPKEGQATADKLIKVSENFLNISPTYLGSIAEDLSVQKAVKKQKPYIVEFENCTASKDIIILAQKITGKDTTKEKKGILNIFNGFFSN